MLVFSLLTGIVVISDYQLNIFTVLDDLCTAQYPGNMAERENRWEIPAFINARIWLGLEQYEHCLLYTSPSPRDRTRSRMPSSA